MHSRPLVLATISAALMFLLLLGGLITPATAATRASADCMNTAATQTAMNRCAGARYQQADGRLNRQYQTLIARLADRPARRQLLVAAQRQWLVFRDAECRFDQSSVAGGSAEPMVRLQCLEQLTDARSNRLYYYLRCQEGDLACPAAKQRTPG